MAICAKCGEAVPEDAAFCPFCSTDIAPAAPASAAVTAPRPPLAAPSPPPPPPTSTRPSSQPPPAPAVPATPPRGSSCLIVALILALVLVLTIVGVIAYLAWIGSSHPAAPGPHAQTAPIAPAPGTKPQSRPAARPGRSHRWSEAGGLRRGVVVRRRGRSLGGRSALQAGEVWQSAGRGGRRPAMGGEDRAETDAGERKSDRREHHEVPRRQDRGHVDKYGVEREEEHHHPEIPGRRR